MRATIFLGVIITYILLITAIILSLQDENAIKILILCVFLAAFMLIFLRSNEIIHMVINDSEITIIGTVHTSTNSRYLVSKLLNQEWDTVFYEDSARNIGRKWYYDPMITGLIWIYHKILHLREDEYSGLDEKKVHEKILDPEFLKQLEHFFNPAHPLLLVFLYIIFSYYFLLGLPVLVNLTLSIIISLGLYTAYFVFVTNRFREKIFARRIYEESKKKKKVVVICGSIHVDPIVKNLKKYIN
jgi:hypothetical protein